MANLMQRRRYLVDPKVQRVLIRRIALYWLLCITVVCEILMGLQICDGPGGSFLEEFRFDLLWKSYGAAAIASLFVLPILLLDTVTMTNRFAGPMNRLRHGLRALAAGEAVEPLTFREKDFYEDLAVEFNALRAYVEKLKQTKFQSSDEPVDLIRDNATRELVATP